MAGQWRIRHKLMLGLGLVVAVMAVLLAGTVKGVLSYRASTNSIESKVGELQCAQQLKFASGIAFLLGWLEDGLIATA